MNPPPSKEEIKIFLKNNRKDFPRDLVADAVQISKSTLDNCLSTEPMTESMRYGIARFTGMISEPSTAPLVKVPDHIIQLEVAHEDHKRWAQHALAEHKTVADWLTNTGNAHAEHLLRAQFNLVPDPETPAEGLLNEAAEQYTSDK